MASDVFPAFSWSQEKQGSRLNKEPSQVIVIW